MRSLSSRIRVVPGRGVDQQHGRSSAAPRRRLRVELWDDGSDKDHYDDKDKFKHNSLWTGDYEVAAEACVEETCCSSSL